MTEQFPTLQEKDISKGQLEELATGFRLLGDDSSLKRFYARLAKKDADHLPTPFDMAEAAMSNGVGR